MARSPNAGSTLSYDSGINKTSTSISTHMIIKVNGVSVGAITDLSINERREVAMISEVGTDGIIDSVPQRSAEVTGSCKRTRFDRLRISQAFGRGFLHVQSQRYPFDIEIIDIQKENPSAQIITTIKNVWITGLSYSFSSDNWVIVDNMEWKAETIYSLENNTAVGSINPAGERTDVLGFVDVYEQEADSGKRRGALDASGLIDLGSGGGVF